MERKGYLKGRLFKGAAVHLKGIVPAELALCDRAASFLQSGFWGGFKARFGWEAWGFQAEWAGGESLPLLVMRRHLVPGLYFAYVPWGPELPGNFSAPPGGGTDAGMRGEALAELARALKPFLPGNTAFIRFDPPWYREGPGVPPPPLGKPFYRAGADVQPPDTVLIDLAKPEAALLGEMKPKWRYNIRLAERKGVRVRRADGEGLPVFYALFRETGRRDGIAIHSLEYYRTLFSHCRDYSGGGQEIRLYLADHEGEPLAAIITLFRGPDAVYLYGASSGRKRNLMAPYLLQWRAMGDARAAGCLRYDLFGIPPGEDPLHPMAGLYRFKTGFGGRIIHRPGSWDYPCRPLA
ncbi:MAG: peptidoglycan bridge formation glycyltransferase FemA/FemB family protein, partial [Treponema sp.]|nr:peptidoglycan bridge formation glycyltransferase FemA/FemB family protein [Treponema sp.]